MSDQTPERAARPYRKVPVEEVKDKGFDFLTPRSFVAIGGHHFWTCECVCGKEVVRRQDYILKGAAKSCGCSHPRRSFGVKHPTFRGVGEIGRTYLNQLRRHAGDRSIKVEVTDEYLWQLFLDQGRKCALTGVELAFSSHKARKYGLEAQTASLDRVDSGLGYVEGNCWWVHKDANKMKREYPLERFVEVCRQVAEHYKGHRAA